MTIEQLAFKCSFRNMDPLQEANAKLMVKQNRRRSWGNDE